MAVYTVKDYRFFGSTRITANTIQYNPLFKGFCKAMGIKPSFSAALDCLHDKRRWVKYGPQVRTSVFTCNELAMAA